MQWRYSVGDPGDRAHDVLHGGAGIFHQHRAVFDAADGFIDQQLDFFCRLGAAEIASASDEQSRGIEQVTQAVTQMDQVTQQNAALVVESASAAAALEEQAITLADAVLSRAAVDVVCFMPTHRQNTSGLCGLTIQGLLYRG
jgi:hypothetical protein